MRVKKARTLSFWTPITQKVLQEYLNPNVDSWFLTPSQPWRLYQGGSMKRNTQLAELKPQAKHNSLYAAQSDCSGRFGKENGGAESD